MMNKSQRDTSSKQANASGDKWNLNNEIIKAADKSKTVGTETVALPGADEASA